MSGCVFVTECALRECIMKRNRNSQQHRINDQTEMWFLWAVVSFWCAVNKNQMKLCVSVLTVRKCKLHRKWKTEFQVFATHFVIMKLRSVFGERAFDRESTTCPANDWIKAKRNCITSTTCMCHVRFWVLRLSVLYAVKLRTQFWLLVQITLRIRSSDERFVCTTQKLSCLVAAWLSVPNITNAKQLEWASYCVAWRVQFVGPNKHYFQKVK